MPKRKRVELLIFPVLTLLLELLPIGVGMTWSPEPEKRVTAFYAYFNALPFGYGVFGPLIAAFLTVAVLIAAFFSRRQRRLRTLPVLSGAALLAALSPLCYVPETFTVWGGFICLLLALELIFSLLPERKN